MNTYSSNVAQTLLQIKAIKLRPANPFTWASGWKSPIYCDNRTILSYPEARTSVCQGLAEIVKKSGINYDFIAGVATGAIAQGVLVAQLLDKPFVYVRPKPKEHGMGNQIEGHLPEGSKVMVIEDLISTGGSSLKAVDALRKANCEVVGMVAIFTYGFPVAEESFAKADVKLETLSDYNSLIEIAAQTGYIKSDEQEALKEWRVDPANWRNELK